jgi:hypothetical protein
VILMMLSTLAASGDAAPLEEGTYAFIVDSASTSHLAVSGTTRSVSRSLSRVQLVRGEEGGWTATQQVCDIRVTSDSKADTMIPRAFVRALPVQTYPVQLTRKADGTWRYAADPGPSHLGYDPKASGGVLPEKPSDPGVLDQDGDGHPGVTVRLRIPLVGTVRMYVVQHGHSRFEGVVQDGGVRGRVEQLVLEQRTLGSSFAPLAATPTLTPDPGRSRFRLDKVADERSCTSLRSAWDGAFSPPSG